MTTEAELDALAPDWFRVFGEAMPRGFEIGPDQVPILKECLRTKSQKPLEAFVESLPPADF